MDKKQIKHVSVLCPCCMENHRVHKVEIREQNIFKKVKVEYSAEYFYCDKADEYYADEFMLQANDISMKNAYRRELGLLTSDEISAIREKYGISQSDLCSLLGWGRKTITRYEGHQVQDAAHDAIMRKLSDDPEWFLSLLAISRKTFPDKLYMKYREKAISLFEREDDVFLRKSILAKYARFQEASTYSGNIQISLDVVIDVIRYFSNAAEMMNLYKGKLMKLLWYSDALSYKRREHAITGLVYRALPMGVVPVAHDFIIDLRGVEYEEIDMGEGSGCHFKETADKKYRFLAKEDIGILDEIIHAFGKLSKDAIMDSVCKEQAYIETVPGELISFEHAKELSIN